MKKFEIGKEYFTHSICDSECRFTIKITGRTEKTVSYIYDGESRRSKIRVDESGEYIQPDKYSMAPVFRASREYAGEISPSQDEPGHAENQTQGDSGNVIVLSRPAAAVIVMLGQRIFRNCGAPYPLEWGTVVGFVDVPSGRFSRGGVHASVRWDGDSETPSSVERVPLSEIHPQDWRSAGGSPIGVFVAQ